MNKIDKIYNHLDQDKDRFELLKKKVAKFPSLPGVYIMRNKDGQILYIGKAISLVNRVKSYFGSGDGRIQVKYLIERVFDIEVVVCETESQALVLERDLIRTHKPRYNIKLKDDKNYMSIRVDTQHPWPRLQTVRKRREDSADYYGPFPGTYQLRQVLDIIKRTIPLRTCSDNVFYNRQRPCIEYQIKRCSGPCCIPVDGDDYKEWLEQAVEILNGNFTDIIVNLTEKMEKASSELRFEDAATLRDRIEALENFATGTKDSFSSDEYIDVFYLHRDGAVGVLNLLSVRNGRIQHSKNYTFSEIHIRDSELIESAIDQIYRSGRELPSEIVVHTELENGAMVLNGLQELHSLKSKLTVPQKGLKFRILELARLNAEQAFRSEFDLELRYGVVSELLMKMLKLEQSPRRIECVDISNLGDSDIVGGLVCYFDGTPLKRGYRKYKIKSTATQDDFQSIYEVVFRRLKEAVETGEFPDVLIIDGGRGQLSAALKAREDLGVELGDLLHVDIVSLAKIREQKGGKFPPERFFVEWQEEPILLAKGEEVTKFVAGVRDEVHRFAITFHRSRRTKRQFTSKLDGIPGVGAARKAKIIKEFKGLNEIKDVTAEELAKRAGIPVVIAERIKGVCK